MDLNEGGSVTVTTEFRASFIKLADFLEKKYGEEVAKAKLAALAEYFQGIMDDHEFTDRLVNSVQTGPASV